MTVILDRLGPGANGMFQRRRPVEQGIVQPEAEPAALGWGWRQSRGSHTLLQLPPLMPKGLAGPVASRPQLGPSLALHSMGQLFRVLMGSQPTGMRTPAASSSDFPRWSHDSAQS